jgi:flagellar FliJ protein
MKTLASLIRLHKWTLEEKRRALAALQGLRADLVRQQQELEVEVVREQSTAKGGMESAWTYSGYAKAVIHRRETLKRSVIDVDKRIEQARDAVNVAWREMRKYEIAEERNQARKNAEVARVERLELDEIALTQNRIKQGERG